MSEPQTSSWLVNKLSSEMSLAPQGVAAAVGLLEDGNTIPFIARYRKEATGNLDEVVLRGLAERREYLLAMEERRKVVLAAIEEQGKLSPELRGQIESCDSKSELEDLYLPYKPKRRTRAMMARELGLEPLAQAILAQPTDRKPSELAHQLMDGGADVATIDEALAGARDIVAEVVAERAAVRAVVRDAVRATGVLHVEVVKAKRDERTKFEQYYEYQEPLAKLAGHRFLAIRRGEAEGVLRARIIAELDPVVLRIQGMMGRRRESAFARELDLAVDDSVARLLSPSIENEVRVEMKLRADAEAVGVFADNLENLLLAAPLGGEPVVGIDPGFRTGCKVAAVDGTGRYLASLTIYLSSGAAAVARAKTELDAFLRTHRPTAVAVGNGTGGRETSSFVRELLASWGGSAPHVVMVNEAGASVYSASDIAREEFPDLDLTIRGAISIARRLKDPLAELVKVEPKAIGVGQYQHDVDQARLTRKLGEVIESCVNRVGVELNTASGPLLGYVSGVGPALARKIVAHRNEHGAFAGRKALRDVSGLGAKAFEQCAGFLRVREGEHPLDASAVHPERYAVVEQMAASLGLPLSALVGNAEAVKKIDVTAYVSQGLGEPTLRDIVGELAKPGRDPRSGFEPPVFRDDIQTMNDLRVGMVLPAVVTNVTAFGAFADLGVHQDGLIHISQLADVFVKNPHDVVKVGDKMQVRVLEVDLERKRIALTARKTQPEAVPSTVQPTGAARKSRAAATAATAATLPPRRTSKKAVNPARPTATRRQGAVSQGAGGGSPAAEQAGPAKFANNPFAALAGKRKPG